MAADFTVNAGTTDTTAKTVTGTDTGTVQSGGTLSTAGTAISWTGPSADPGVTINNFGTITSGNRGIDTSGANPPRNLTLNNAAGATFTTTDDTFRLNTPIGTGTVTVNNAGLLVSTGGQVFDFVSNTSATGTVRINNDATGIIRAMGSDAIRPGVGSIIITNSGLIEANNSNHRAITLEAPTTLANVLLFQVFNNAGGTIQSRNDAIRITAPANFLTTTGDFLIDNSGTILSTVSGQAIDFDDIAGAGSIAIINRATGVIQSTAADAVRPGANATVTNYGLIFAGGVVGSGDGSDAVDLQAHSGTVINKAGGTISGFRHGITVGATGTLAVTNEAGGVILGRNGSGVGSDNLGMNAATIVNYGRITGAYAGVGNGDGDGVDIDGSATITNYGIIEGTGAGGFDSRNRSNNSEGLSIGGGTIMNYGTISGATAAIVVNNDSNLDNSRSGVAATSLTNYAGGTITGLNGYAIRFENKTGTAADNDTIVNYGTITGNGSIPDPNAIILLGDGVTPDPGSVGTLNGVTYTGTGSARFIRGDGSAIQTGEGNDSLTNYGTIIGNTGRAINMEGGADTVNIMPGSKIVGLVDGGAGTDTLGYNKVGLGADKMAALRAGETVNIGGTLYRSFEFFTGISSSFADAAGSSAASGLAQLFDNLPNTQPQSLAAQTLIDQVASSDNVAAALTQLTPVAFLSFGTIAIEGAFESTRFIDQRLSNVRLGNAQAFDVRGMNTVAALLNREGNDAPLAAQLNTWTGGMATAYAASPALGGHPAFAAFAKAPAANVYKAPAMDLAQDSPWGMFLYGNATFARQDATATTPQTKFDTAGLSFGIDRRVTPDVTLGLFGGYSRTRADLDTLGSTSRINTWLIGGYGSWSRQDWFVNGAVVFGRNSYDNNRVALGTSNTSAPKGDQLAVQGSVGKDLFYGRWTITPQLGLQYTTVGVDRFTETGPVALNVASFRTESLRSTVGARFRYNVIMDRVAFTPELRASWQHEFLDKDRDIRASFLDSSLPGTFTTTAAGSGANFGTVGAGVSANVAERTQLSFGYDFKFGGHDFTAHTLSGRLRHEF
ncbi:MAG: autotransporter outer membrane beta-barrel domain-containing protein [Pseudolabrys sp.]|nr:autotransporter outer membrane beta-barrel domain-containing protein [Pseudolabrys sp.]